MYKISGTAKMAAKVILGQLFGTSFPKLTAQ